MICTNSSSIFRANVVCGLSVLQDESIFGSNSTMVYNVVQNSSLLQIGSSFGDVVNNIIQSQSNLIVGTLQSKAEVSGNTISSDSQIDIGTLATFTGVNYNVLSGSSQFKASLATINANILRNSITKKSILEVSSVSVGSQILNCDVSAGIINLGALTTAKSDLSFRIGYSNWEADLDFGDIAIYDLPTQTLTIPTALSYVGKFNTLNSIGLTVTDIVNLPTNHPVTFTPDNTGANDFTLQYTAVGIAVADKIIRSFAAASDTFTAAAGGGSEFVILNKFGVLNGVLSKYNWQ